MNKILTYPLVFGMLAASFVATSAFAAPPDAGTLLNEQRQPGSKLPDRLPKPEEKGVQRAPLSDSGVKVTVKAIRFTGGADIATEAELQALVAGSIGRQLGFTELQALAERVTAYLREKKGYLLAKAYLPKQDVTEGTIEIAIIAGKIDGKTRIDLKGKSRIDKERLQGMADGSIPRDGAVRMEQIEHAVLLMNDLPGINASASLEPGKSPGTTAVVITTQEGPLLTGSVSGDNYGDRYTGAWRGTGQIAANDPFGLGDQLSFSLTGAEHMFQGHGAYSLPLGSGGINWSLYYTGLYYELGGPLTSLNATGRADTIGTSLSYPLLRSRSASLWANAGFEYLMMVDDLANATNKGRNIPVGNVGLSTSIYDTLGGGGLTSGNITLYSGSLDQSGPATVGDLSNSDGNFFRATYSLARLQHLTGQLSLFASLRGQFAAGNLDSSQKFILGGPSGVRAYPVGESAGDEGHALTVEARYDVPGMPAWATTQLVGFFDSGWIELHQSPWANSVSTISGKNDYWLSGGGVGLNIGKAGLYSLRAAYARTVDNNKGRSINDRDTDGRSEDDRFWLQAVVWF